MRKLPWYTGTTGQCRHRCLQPRLPSTKPADAGGAVWQHQVGVAREFGQAAAVRHLERDSAQADDRLALGRLRSTFGCRCSICPQSLAKGHQRRAPPPRPARCPRPVGAAAPRSWARRARRRRGARAGRVVGCGAGPPPRCGWRYACPHESPPSAHFSGRRDRASAAKDRGRPLRSPHA